MNTFDGRTIRYAKLVCRLPEWWDERGKWCIDPSGHIVIAHPDHEPMWFDGEWHKPSDSWKAQKAAQVN